MWKKLRNMIGNSCDILELLMAFLILLATIVGIISLWEPFVAFVENRYDGTALLTFVGYVFNIVIAIEFLKMLSRPSVDTVLEVLTFLVARHMVLVPTTVVENLISIICIGLLFAMKKFLHLPASEDKADIFVSDYDWDSLRKKRKESYEENIKEKAKRLAEDLKDIKEDLKDQ